MAIKYKYNTHTLSYEKILPSLKDRLMKVIYFTAFGLVFSGIFLFIAYNFYDSPKEKMLRRENEQLKLQFELLDGKISQLNNVLEDLQKRDDNIYRVIFEAEPIPVNIRKAGFGGVYRYKELEGYNNSEIVIRTAEKLDKLSKQIYIQSKSFDEVFELAKEKEQMLMSIPAIQPISNKDLTRMASGFGYRIHPIYKTNKFHYGMDFTASTGTDIYATGSGVVEHIEESDRGLGIHVIINHGFGYKTIYGHMSAYKVKKGQKVNRGEVIGYVGNTGTSTAPHLHYEVQRGNEKVNPVNYYFNDLTPAEYEKMLQISSASNQSFD